MDAWRVHLHHSLGHGGHWVRAAPWDSTAATARAPYCARLHQTAPPAFALPTPPPFALASHSPSHMPPTPPLLSTHMTQPPLEPPQANLAKHRAATSLNCPGQCKAKMPLTSRSQCLSWQDPTSHGGILSRQDRSLLPRTWARQGPLQWNRWQMHDQDPVGRGFSGAADQFYPHLQRCDVSCERRMSSWRLDGVVR